MSDEFLFESIFDSSACVSEDDDFEKDEYSISINESAKD
jgi:hypothetical protein